MTVTTIPGTYALDVHSFQNIHHLLLFFHGYDVVHDHLLIGLSGFPIDYHSLFHSYGEHVHAVKYNVQDAFPLPSDVRIHSLWYSHMDGLEILT